MEGLMGMVEWKNGILLLQSIGYKLEYKKHERILFITEM